MCVFTVWADGPELLANTDFLSIMMHSLFLQLFLKVGLEHFGTINVCDLLELAKHAKLAN